MSKIRLDITPSDRLHAKEDKFKGRVEICKSQELEFHEALAVIVSTFNYSRQLLVHECIAPRLVIDCEMPHFFERGMVLSSKGLGDIPVRSFSHKFVIDGYPDFPNIQLLVKAYLTAHPRFASDQARKQMFLPRVA